LCDPRLNITASNAKISQAKKDHGKFPFKFDPKIIGANQRYFAYPDVLRHDQQFADSIYLTYASAALCANAHKNKYFLGYL
jgi:hypothetical protein